MHADEVKKIKRAVREPGKNSTVVKARSRRGLWRLIRQMSATRK